MVHLTFYASMPCLAVPLAVPLHIRTVLALCVTEGALRLEAQLGLLGSCIFGKASTWIIEHLVVSLPICLPIGVSNIFVQGACCV